MKEKSCREKILACSCRSDSEGLKELTPGFAAKDNRYNSMAKPSLTSLMVDVATARIVLGSEVECEANCGQEQLDLLRCGTFVPDTHTHIH